MHGETMKRDTYWSFWCSLTVERPTFV